MQTCPYSPELKIYSDNAQAPLPPDNSKPLNKKGILKIQQIVGSILYYAQAVDSTVLMSLSSIAPEQTKATEKNSLKMSATPRLSGFQSGRKNPF